MRFLIKVLVLLGVLAVLGAGLLPPLFDRANLDSVALDAARAASSAVAASSASDAAQTAAAQSVAGHRGVSLINVSIETGGLAPAVSVTVSEHVHTFMDGLPGLESWFHISATEASQLGE